MFFEQTTLINVYNDYSSFKVKFRDKSFKLILLENFFENWSSIFDWNYT